MWPVQKCPILLQNMRQMFLIECGDGDYRVFKKKLQLLLLVFDKEAGEFWWKPVK